MARKFSYESSGLGSIVPIALVGGVGFLAYKYWDDISRLLGQGYTAIDKIGHKEISNILPNIIPPHVISTLPNIPLSITNPSGNPNITVGSNVNAPSNSGSSDSTYAKMSRWISGNIDWYTSHQGLATFDEWNSIRGEFESNSETIEDVFPEVSRNATMTLQEYFNGLTSKGISGLGLGRIIDMDTFFGNGPRLIRKGNFR